MWKFRLEVLETYSGLALIHRKTVDTCLVTATHEQTVNRVSALVPLPQTHVLIVRATQKRFLRNFVFCACTKLFIFTYVVLLTSEKWE